MIEKKSHKGEGQWKVLVETEGWNVAFLRYGEKFAKYNQMERHLETDEVFVLLEGTATLYTPDEVCEMEPMMVYNIPKGEWHHITVSRDATVLVIENANTTKENSESKFLESEE